MGTRADELFEQLYATGGAPTQIDAGIGRSAVRILDAPKSPLLWVPVRDPTRLAYMMPAAEHRFEGSSAVGAIACAAYTDADVCPLPRLYFWTAHGSREVDWGQHLGPLAEQLHRWTAVDLQRITPPGDARELLDAFNKAQWGAIAPGLHEYLLGRKANTTLRGAVYQHSKQCLVHESALGHPSMMTLCLETGAGALIVDLCDQCRTSIAAGGASTIEYLSERLRLPQFPFSLRPITRADLLAHAEGVMVAELGCSDVKLNEGNSMNRPGFAGGSHL